MNKQSLYLVGGSLLASTALATGAQAAIIKANPGAGNVAATTAITAKGLATQVFGTTGQGAVTLGTSTQTVLIDFTSSYTSVYNIQVDLVGTAEFTGVATATPVYQGSVASGGTIRAASTTGCTVQTLADKLLISNCDSTGGIGAGSISRVDALILTGIQFTSAGSLATAGTSLSLSGIVRNSSNAITFENITSAAYVTSKSAGETAIEAGTAITVDNAASPAFTKVTATGSTLTAELGTVHFSGTSAVGTDLSVTFLTAASITSTAEVKITHGVLSDDAVSLVNVTGATKTPAQFVSGTVSFQVAQASLNGAAIKVAFNGTAQIDAASGSATVTPTILAPLASAVASYSGSLASLSRGGLSIQLNTVLSSASTGYSSFVRVVNSSTVDGTATVTVKNDATGAALGSYTTATIPAGGTLTISSSAIESALSLTASATVNYKVTVAGSFNGYAQHLVFNSVSGVFSDFSGFRKGALSIEP